MTKSEIRQHIKSLKASIPNTQKEIDAAAAVNHEIDFLFKSAERTNKFFP